MGFKRAVVHGGLAKDNCRDFELSGLIPESGYQGCGQMVRHRILIPGIMGSNPIILVSEVIL